MDNDTFDTNYSVVSLLLWSHKKVILTFDIKKGVFLNLFQVMIFIISYIIS